MKTYSIEKKTDGEWKVIDKFECVSINIILGFLEGVMQTNFLQKNRFRFRDNETGQILPKEEIK